MEKEYSELIEVAKKFNSAYEIFKVNDESLAYSFMLSNGLTGLVLSKKHFKRNNDVLKFLNEELQMDLPEYLQHNRTLLLGRVLKWISELEDINQIKSYLNTVYNELSGNNESDWSSVIKSINLEG